METTMSAAKPILHVPRASRPCAAQRHRFFSLREHGRDAHGTKSAFSLVELLVVIGLIVVVMALALPAFNFISGSKSIDGATNVISAYLGRARAEAIAAGKPTGVLFYIDPVTDRRMMVMVQEAPARVVRNPNQGVMDQMDVFLDLIPDTEPVAMPLGVEVQFINDGSAAFTNAGAQYFDRYIGFNNAIYQGPKTITEVRYGSVILFDGSGRLVSKTVAFRCFIDYRDPSNTLRARRTRIGALFLGGDFNPEEVGISPPTSSSAGDIVPARANQANALLRSALGFVIVEQERFTNAGGSLADPQLDSGAAGNYALNSPEFNEEKWLDENATPLLINRYNGTLVKGQ